MPKAFLSRIVYCVFTLKIILFKYLKSSITSQTSAHSRQRCFKIEFSSDFVPSFFNLKMFKLIQVSLNIIPLLTSLSMRHGITPNDGFIAFPFLRLSSVGFGSGEMAIPPSSATIIANVQILYHVTVSILYQFS